MRVQRFANNNTLHFSKVPLVTFTFWVVKILATTVGETGGDALSMTLKFGYAVSSLIFLAFFFVALSAQVGSKRYHPVFYWAVVVATTTVGTTTSDYLDRTVGLGYVKSSIMLFCAVVAVLVACTLRPAVLRLTISRHAKTRFFIGSQFWYPIRLGPH